MQAVVGIWDGMLRRGMSSDREWGGRGVYMGLSKGTGRGRGGGKGGKRGGILCGGVHGGGVRIMIQNRLGSISWGPDVWS